MQRAIYVSLASDRTAPRLRRPHGQASADDRLLDCEFTVVHLSSFWGQATSRVSIPRKAGRGLGQAHRTLIQSAARIPLWANRIFWEQEELRRRSLEAE